MNDIKATTETGQPQVTDLKAPPDISYYRKHFWQKDNDRIKMLADNLDMAVKSANASASRWEEIFKEFLDNGGSTGNPLQDELIRWLGLRDMTAHDRFLDFNHKLIEGKGKELLLVSFCQLPIIEGGNPTNVWKYFFGVLSGSRMTAHTIPEGTTVSLPFERYFTWGRRQKGSAPRDLIGRGETKRVQGPLELDWHTEPGTQALCDFLARKERQDGLSQMADFEGKPMILIFIEDQITLGNITKTVGYLPYLGELETVRRGLNAQTETENASAPAAAFAAEAANLGHELLNKLDSLVKS